MERGYLNVPFLRGFELGTGLCSLYLTYEFVNLVFRYPGSTGPFLGTVGCLALSLYVIKRQIKYHSISVTREINTNSNTYEKCSDSKRFEFVSNSDSFLIDFVPKSE